MSEIDIYQFHELHYNKIVCFVCVRRLANFPRKSHRTTSVLSTENQLEEGNTAKDSNIRHVKYGLLFIDSFSFFSEVIFIGLTLKDWYFININPNKQAKDGSYPLRIPIMKMWMGN